MRRALRFVVRPAVLVPLAVVLVATAVGAFAFRERQTTGAAPALTPPAIFVPPESTFDVERFSDGPPPSPTPTPTPSPKPKPKPRPPAQPAGPSLALFRGLGAWVDLYDYADLSPEPSVADMKARGVKTLYLQTGRWNKPAPDDPANFEDRSIAQAWLEAAHAKGIKVVGWYLPAYSEYMATDVRRTIAIATFRSPAGHRFDALAVDIEYKGATSSLDEFNTGIVSHLDQVRAGVGTSYTIGAIVPSPVGMSLSPGSWAGFPWSAIGDRTHVVLPMAYWSYRTDCPSNPAHCPYQYAIDNVAQAKALSGLPVHIIGGVGNDVTSTEVGQFADGVLAAHAYGGSLYDYRTTAAAFWPALEKLNQL